MKSVFYSRFFILLPWVLIVIIVIDIDTKRSSVRNTANFYLSRLGNAPRRDRVVGTSPAVNRTATPVIYAITPTYTRAVQKAELTRLANTFRQVPHFHWIVVEDSNTHTELVSRFLARAGVPHTHLHVFTPRRFKRAGMPRATEQRNGALGWLRAHRTSRDAGVVFFADDDNTYSLELFEEHSGSTERGHVLRLHLSPLAVHLRTRLTDLLPLIMAPFLEFRYVDRAFEKSLRAPAEGKSGGGKKGWEEERRMEWG
ncbi:galactosylgalactosylxylosylprotein 3-beta-glucuronosyltransferase 2 isoform X2 [Brachyhypopomus gauderio]|uniref:galactosylgalactosylxylosylprotein 3-beta-glucuronosyltransferase 2 isoform X2 n=1 Tax=Brachyhypopomus gauderio TaxID=698409 RepID=UPI0040416117